LKDPFGLPHDFFVNLDGVYPRKKVIKKSAARHYGKVFLLSA